MKLFREISGGCRLATRASRTWPIVCSPTHTPEVYTGHWFREAKELAAFRAFLVFGTKSPASR
jgi:hypothetical protein